jgi:hypothetical protein
MYYPLLTILTSPEDEGSMFLQNIGTHLKDYMMQQPKRPVPNFL